MNAGDAVDALIGILVANQVDVNTKLANSGYQVRLDAGAAGRDSSPYRYIKRGDRVKLPDGLTLCFVAGASRQLQYLAPDTAEREATLQIVAYLVNEHDPHAREAARHRVADALRSLYNRTGHRTIETAAGTFSGCEAGEEQFRYFERLNETGKMGQVAAGVVITWRGLYYVQETETSG